MRGGRRWSPCRTGPGCGSTSGCRAPGRRSSSTSEKGSPMTVTLAYTADGPRNAPVLVLGNSPGTPAGRWEPQLPALTRRCRVVRYDHRGHGDSPVPDGPYRLSALGADLLALLD